MLEDNDVKTILQAGSPILYDEIDHYLLGPDTDELLNKYGFLTRFTIYSCIAECYLEYGYHGRVEWWWELLYDSLYRSFEGELEDSSEYDAMITDITTRCLKVCPSLGTKFKAFVDQLGRGTDGIYVGINDTSFESTQVVWYFETQ